LVSNRYSTIRLPHFSYSCCCEQRWSTPRRSLQRKM
jgi:predicted SprT family Zn-dependent metalloprotease